MNKQGDSYFASRTTQSIDGNHDVGIVSKFDVKKMLNKDENYKIIFLQN